MKIKYGAKAASLSQNYILFWIVCINSWMFLWGEL